MLSRAEPIAVSNRARRFPPIAVSPSAMFNATEVAARRSCRAKSRSTRAITFAIGPTLRTPSIAIP